MHLSSLSTTALIGFASFVLAALDGHCPPLGPVLPAPRHPSTDSAVQAAVAAFEALLAQTTSQPRLNESALVVGVKSVHEAEWLLEYAFTPPAEFRDPRGVQEVDSDTVFRIASTSKIFPVLAILKLHGVSLEDPITKYVPEVRALNNQGREQTPIWTYDWESMTLGSLASHLAGLPADLGTDIAEFADLSSYGFPERDESRLLNCSGLLGIPACSREVFFSRFGERPPVQLPFSSNTVYSNIGLALLGFVVEEVTGRPFSEHVVSDIWAPLNMSHTFESAPPDALGFIPPNDQWWNATLGFGAPAGQYYSSLADLIKFGNAVLSHGVGLNASQTYKWLKPVTETSSAGTLVGMPWEIFRAKNLTADGRLLEAYTKGGDIATYHSILALVPDYDLVVTIIIGGAETSGFDVLLLFSQLLETLLPGVEQASKTEAQARYAGTYTDENTNSTVELTLDASPGLNFSRWEVRGVDVLRTYAGINVPPAIPAPLPGTVPPVRFRLYPTTITAGAQESWRAVGTALTAEQAAEADAAFVWDMPWCVTWAQMDRITYQLNGQDHVIFDVGGEGVATTIELVGYNVTLTRQ